MLWGKKRGQDIKISTIKSNPTYTLLGLLRNPLNYCYFLVPPPLSSSMPKVTREKHSERNNPLSQEDRGTDKLGKKAHASTCTDPKCQGCAPVFEDEEGRVVEPRVADLVAAALNEAKDTTGIQPKAVQLFEQAISLAKDRDGQGIREAPVELADTTFAFARYLSLPSLLDEAAGHYERHTDPGTGLLGQILSQLHALVSQRTRRRGKGGRGREMNDDPSSLIAIGIIVD